MPHSFSSSKGRREAHREGERGREKKEGASLFFCSFFFVGLSVHDGEPGDPRPHRAPVPGEEEVSLIEERGLSLFVDHQKAVLISMDFLF